MCTERIRRPCTLNLHSNDKDKGNIIFTTVLFPKKIDRIAVYVLLHVYDLYIHLVYKETGITELSCYTVIGAYTTLPF